MRIAFIVDRLMTFKVYAPVIHEALRRGYQIDCWLNQRDISQTTKWYEFPTIEAAPTFGELKPSYSIFVNDDQLAELNNHDRPDVIFSTRPPPITKQPGQKWAHIVTAFVDSQCGMNPSAMNKFDLIFADTPHWIEEGFRVFQLGNRVDLDPAAMVELHQKFLPTGTPPYEHFDLQTRESARARLGLPPDKKVVLLFKIEAQATFWSKKIFHEPSRLKRLYSFLILPLSYPHFLSRIGKSKLFRMIFKSFLDRLYFLPELFGCPSEKDILLALREFCDRNGYLLVIKYRKKNPLLPFQEIGDLMLADETIYPYTSSVAIKAADLVVTLFSSAVGEAVYAGVPVINLLPSSMDLFYRDQYALLYATGSVERAEAERKTFYNTDSGGPFSGSGAVYNVGIREFSRKFAQKSLADFPPLPTAQEAYRQRFICQDQIPASHKILDQLALIFSN